MHKQATKVSYLRSAAVTFSMQYEEHPPPRTDNPNLSLAAPAVVPELYPLHMYPTRTSSHPTAAAASAAPPAAHPNDPQPFPPTHLLQRLQLPPQRVHT
eukprot:349926-Chlamydomonas_euryale.AAC.1